MAPIDSYVSYAPSQNRGVGCQASPDDTMAFLSTARPDGLTNRAAIG
jgi:hypothetical protein